MIAMITPSMTVSVIIATGGSARRDRAAPATAGVGVESGGAMGRAIPREAMTENPELYDVEGRFSVTTKSLYHIVAYEVTKRVGRRAYRYRVESYRDPESSKVRSRWTYLGVVAGDGAGVAPAKRPSSEDTRERLILAFEELVADLPYRDITAGAIATKAGLAHGTFYRYFADKRSLLIAAIARVRLELDRVNLDFGSPIGTRAQERARLRTWILTLYRWPGRNPGLYRAFVDAHDADEELREHKRARVAERAAQLTAYFERLNEGGIAEIDNPAVVASSLTTLVNGSLRELFTSGASSGEDGIAEIFDRAIFAPREPPAELAVTS
jgi:AcrR family transcriptional regulator